MNNGIPLFKGGITMIINDKALAALVAKHRRTCDWREGEPVELFSADGLPCVRYESGAWWHYDLQHGSWF